MFSSALKSFTSNISSNYTVDTTQSSSSGPWKIYGARKKFPPNKEVSVFVFDRKYLEPQSGGLGRSGGASVKKAQDEAIERLKKEASLLARLRHPCILELAEPVEETRSGGLQFATEPVTTSLGGLLLQKDDEERSGGIGGRSSRYVIDEGNGGGRRRREVEIDELEIQKGLLQIAKGLQFLHESAGLIHGDLCPNAVFINSKSDWKISGLGFASPPTDSTIATSVVPLSLAEVLNHDPRLPRSLQLNLDFCSPDFVMDFNLNTLADMYSLGLLIVALYNSPHESPLKTSMSISNYKRAFGTESTMPTFSNRFLCSKSIPKELLNVVLPRILARKPAQRMNAREFQESRYFDNILVSSIRFLDSLPAKTPNEKAQFMRGLPRVLHQFPKSVLEKKVLPALLEEMKDKDLLPHVLKNVFKTIELLPSKQRAFTDRVIPKLKEVFSSQSSTLTGKHNSAEKDSSRDVGLMVIFENMTVVTESCSENHFKDGILPIVYLSMESSTHSLIDISLRTLPIMLPMIDFSTLKNDLFPVIASVFSKTNSLGIKIRGLEAFKTLCGAETGGVNAEKEFMNGDVKKHGSGKPNKNAALDKYTIQEKLIPLLRSIKTKEPAVMIAALEVFKKIGEIADIECLVAEVLPVLWTMSLGPLLDLQQFERFMSLIKTLSGRVERQQAQKLRDLSSSQSSIRAGDDDFMSFGNALASVDGFGGDQEDDFERLVLGKQKAASSSMGSETGAMAKGSPMQSLPNSITQNLSNQSTFGWSSAAIGNDRPQPSFRTVTPDLAAFTPLTPGSNMGQTALTGTILSPSNATGSMSTLQPQAKSQQLQALNHYSSPPQQSNQWSNHTQGPGSAIVSSTAPVFPNSTGSFGMNQQLPGSQVGRSQFSIPPPPSNNVPQSSGHFSSTLPVQNPSWNISSPPLSTQNSVSLSLAQNTKPKSGLDAYESLL